MLQKHNIISRIIDVGVVAIVRTDKAEQATNIVQACLDGGLTSVEITFTVDSAHRIIEQVHMKHTHCILGAGTVLDAHTARIAILAGASYIVSPSFDTETAKLCNRYAIPYMAGCYTPTEVAKALEYGVEIIKLFPSTLLSPSAITAIKAPFPQANIMPTGGVSLDNVDTWIKAGAIAIGVGGDLTAGAKTNDYAQIRQKASEYKQAVEHARNNRT